MDPLLITAGAVILAVVGYGVYVVIEGRRSEVEERLGRYTAAAEEPREREAGKRPSPLTERLDKALAGRGFAENTRAQLARADLKLTVGEYLAAIVIVAVLLSGTVYFLSSGNLVFVLAAGVLGVFMPNWYVKYLQGKRLKAFNNQLGDTINLLVNSIRAGYSVLQAMEAVGEEMGPPTSVEYRRVVREVQLGIGMEQALSNMLRRVRSDDLDLMITAMNVQREVGGNLAEVLDSISFTIRERVRIKGEIQALTAMGRYSGYIISLLPVAVFFFVFAINRTFMTPMIEDPCGWVMIGVAISGIVLGYIIIQKIVKIEI
jgi:tight adherence protein B